MKHINKIIIPIMIIAALIAAFVIGYVDINTRFPQPIEELYEAGEYVEYDDGIKIKVVSAKYCTAKQYNMLYGTDSNFDRIVVKVVLKNETSVSADYTYYNQLFTLVIYPIGYENQGTVVSDTTNVPPGKEEEIYISFPVSEALLPERYREKAFKQDIMFCLKAYPVRQAIVLKGINGYEKN